MSQTKTNQGIIDIIDSIPIGILIMDQQGDVLFSNNSAIRILDINLYDLIDRRLSDIVKDERMRFALTSLQSGLTGQTIFEINNGGKVINVTLKNISSDKFGSGSTIVILEDVTKFHEITNIKTEFVSTLLHRLRTPLTTIKSSLAFLQHPNLSLDTEESKEVLTMCHSETNRLNFFLNDLRDLFLIEAGIIEKTIERALISLGPLLEKTIRTIEADALAKNVSISFDKDACLCLIEGDADRLTQALTNIMVNAVTFTESGGGIAISVNDESDLVRISVIDTGIGMTDEELSHVFEKHYRADNEITRNTVGYGLGLYISKFLIEYMGGKIYAYSEMGRGSQFDIAFSK